MTGQIVFYLGAIAIWLFFRLTTRKQREHILVVSLWVSVGIGALGFLIEVAARGGGIPITN